MSAAHPAGEPLTVLIASPLEPEHVRTIGAVAPDRVRVLYEPDLLPRPRYVADHHGEPRVLTEAQLGRWRSLLAQADILFDFDWMAASRLPETAPRLKWVQATSAGIGEFVEQTGLAASGLIFTTAAGVHAVPLAEFVILALLYFTKDVPFLLRRQAARHWERYTAEQLDGRRVLLIGLGAVGREIARRCALLGLEVWAMRREPSATLPEGVRRLVTPAELGPALGQADALVVACPLTRQTRGLIGPREIAALKPSAIVVNVGRGPVIDQTALTAALRDGRLRGAALDVFETEPLPPEDELWSLPNVLVSPHSASTVSAENGRIVEIFTTNLRRYLAGEPLVNRFEAGRGY